ncbi:MAG: HAMP domain-containing histidine kinase [Anaerolineales bacterium]|nr:HAMP domain-containing histidine kinase [Anaerolineales bacterium]
MREFFTQVVGIQGSLDFWLGVFIVFALGVGFLIFRWRAIKARLETLEKTIAEQENATQQNLAFMDYMQKFSHTLPTSLQRFKTQLGNLQLPNLTATQRADIIQRLKGDIQTLEKDAEHFAFILKAENPTIGLTRESVDLKQLIESVTQTYENHAKGIKLISKIPADPAPPLWADARELAKLLHLLLENSFKYARPESQYIFVTLEVHQPTKRILLSVQDDGIGIPAKDAQRVFEPGFRVPNKLTHEQAGSGYGLPVAKAIVERHQGTIEVVPQDGPGTLIQCVFPLS